jgi:peroxiredoxin
MHRATDDLRNSGIMDRVLKEGQTAPSFELKNSRGDRVSLAGLLERGPVVLTFFRGHW